VSWWLVQEVQNKRGCGGNVTDGVVGRKGGMWEREEREGREGREERRKGKNGGKAREEGTGRIDMPQSGGLFVEA
jgi:hypothetical protein